MRPRTSFFVVAIVASAALLSVVFCNAWRMDPTIINVTENTDLLEGRRRNIEREEKLVSTNRSTSVWPGIGYVPQYEFYPDLLTPSNESLRTISGGKSLEYVSFDEKNKLGTGLTDRRLKNESIDQEAVPSTMISEFEFLLNEENDSENLTLIEETLWSKANSSKNRRVKRDSTNEFIVEDLEQLYGNDDLTQQELKYLIRRVVEDLEKCDLMSLFSNFVSIPGYDSGKKSSKSYKFFRGKRSVQRSQINSELPEIETENGPVLPDVSKEAQIKKEAKKILKRSKRSFDKIFSFLKPGKALRLVPELIRGEGYPSEIHEVVTEDGYVLELHRIPAPRNTKKSHKKKFQKRDVHPDGGTPDRFFENIIRGSAPNILRSPSGFNKIENVYRTTSEALQADQVLSLLNKNSDYFSIFPQATGTIDLKFSTANTEKFEDKSFVDESSVFSESLERSSESDATNSSYPANLDRTRTKRSPAHLNYYPIFVPAHYDSSPEYVTSNLKRKKIPTSNNINEVFDVFLEKWVPRPRFRRPSVLVHHGLFASSANFVLSDGEGGALAYMLANAGYDVWLGNWRGNTYSTGHARLDPTSRQYWNFSLDEIIKYDIPAAVNYILAVSGQHKLRYVGHSLGCAMLFGATNEDPSLASKVKMMIAMAPAAFMDNSYGALKNTILSVKNFYYLLDRLRLPDLLSPAPLQVQVANHFCGPSSFWRVPCLLMVDAFMGKVKEPMKEYYTNVLLSHFPSTLASTRILAHFGQFVNSYGMRKYNYGPDGNYVRYGQLDPPKYRLSTVTFPVVIFWGPGDTVVTPEDALQSAMRLPNLIVAIPVYDDDFNHLDFIFPEQAQGLVYRPILQVLDFYR